MNLPNANRRSRLKSISLGVVLTIMICFLVASPFGLAREAEAFNFSGSLGNLAQEAGFSTGQSAPSLAVIIGGIIYGALSLLGVVSLLVIIIAGYRWMMAGGNEETITNARAQIKNAIVGVIITLGAYAITYFVVTRLI